MLIKHCYVGDCAGVTEMRKTWAQHGPSGSLQSADGGGGRFEGNKPGAETRSGPVASVWADDDDSLRASAERIEKRTETLEIFGSLNWQRDGVA